MASGKGNPALLACFQYVVHGCSCQEGNQCFPEKIQAQVMGKRLLKKKQKMCRTERITTSTMSLSCLKSRTQSRPAHLHTCPDNLAPLLLQLGTGEGLFAEM